ncbi:DUF1697 domain-containing protein [Saccharopolyspora terrae]|uniref:DUF1697 domain-containing protein n=1 Tax=Saccharopolyspora terrae TaxID=2530384 RepID=UPI00140433DF|nr:DUF1697 domain-containing protein [Saccharopolyspora terrae]
MSEAQWALSGRGGRIFGVSTFVALLRAVNLGSHARLPMARLREMLGELGWQQPRTYLQSGNAVFTAPLAADEVAVSLREKLSADGLDTEVMIRPGDHLRALAAAGHPFAAPGVEHPKLQVAFPLHPVDARRVAAMPVPGGEAARAADGEVFLHYPDGVGRSKLTTAHLQRHLGTPVTCRNWKTVCALAQMC